MDATIWHALTLVGIAVVVMLLLVLGSRLTGVQRRLNDLTHEVRRERKPRRADRGSAGSIGAPAGAAPPTGGVGQAEGERGVEAGAGGNEPPTNATAEVAGTPAVGPAPVQPDVGSDEQPAEATAQAKGAPPAKVAGGGADVGPAHAGAEASGSEPQANEDASRAPDETETEGQPFERDGRWWFRRGDELLVYDESTGQWLAAGHRHPSGGPADRDTDGGLSHSGEDDEAGRMHYPNEDAGGPFWKCPSCGTVNGSTATSCRMCFAARP